MRRLTVLSSFALAALLLAGCPTDKGTNRSALGATTTTQPPSGSGGGSTSSTTPGGGTAPGGPTTPGQDPRVGGDVPANVVIGGAKLQAVATGTGQVTDITRPPLGNALQVTRLLDRAQGLVVVVRGPLPQDPGAVYVLGDAAHQPRAIGTGISVVAGATDHELWVADPTAIDGLTAVRRVDIGQEAPAQVQRLPRGRALAGYGAGGIVLGVQPDPDGEVIGSVDVMDPVKGTLARHLADSGSVIAADGQRAVVLVDGGCTGNCTLKVAGPTTDRTFDLPAGLVPEPGGATSAAATVFVGRSRGGPRHIWVLSLTDGTAKDTGTALPPATGAAPMAMDTTGAWAFTRSGPSTLVGIRVRDAQAEELPWPLDPWGAIAVTAGGTCACNTSGGGGAPVI